ncbi:YtjB family periplasmic protein [Serratia rhizosphaerae]|uniref:YtjB family periplasmic protein n=1 Tax=Serratia rhizosphaerae TaxID=2597702 RepID=A0ABX6GKD1_9GAMM|nr:YtjB family periplasmic protein [Serratia rhizosphaerae]MEB6334843.1 YtjB family periplasmic protein [Serratia rhizosphaerae]QHA86701.1 YtjB family periplasmic protein [Serratia rhizosphaerae]
MATAKLKFRLHRTAIILICLALLVLLMQGASYFSLSHQLARSEQVEDLAQTLTKQVAFSLAPLLDDDSDIDNQRIDAILTQMTDHSRILDASVYQLDGTLIAHAGETISVRDRLSLDGKRAGGYFNNQLVEAIKGKDGPCGFIRITLDTHVLATEAKQVDNTTNLLRLMMLLSLAIGIILARCLLQGRRSRWQQSPYLLTANTPLAESDDEKQESAAPSSGDNETRKP